MMAFERQLRRGGPVFAAVPVVSHAASQGAVQGILAALLARARGGRAMTQPALRGWMRWLPGIAVLRRYQLAWLPHDVIAGLVLTTMLVPVGVAYAVASVCTCEYIFEDLNRSFATAIAPCGR